VSAHEIEHALLTSLLRLLRDRTRLVKLLKARGSLTDLPAALRFSSTAAEKMKSGLPHEKRELLLQLLNKVTLNKKRLLVEIKRDVFFGTAANASKSDFTVEIPILLKQRGVETRLIIEGETEAPHNRDAALIKTIARAVSWFDDLATGRVKDFSDLGRKEKLTRSVVGRICSLAFLSPELIEDVMNGRQALNVRTRNLLREVSLPESWAKQQKVFAP
jgi:hypothetical protein